MVGWYKHDIPAWMDGTENLSDGAYRAYHVICQLIYLNEGPIALNEHGIAGRCRQSIRAFRRNLQELISAGKLSLENGRLRNSRADSELEKVAENRINAGKGGENSGESRMNPGKSQIKSSKSSEKLDEPNISPAKALKTNDPPQATLQTDRSLKEKRREEERSNKIRRVAAATPTDDKFEEFWREYPKRKGDNPKNPARKLFDAAVKQGADPNAIISGVKIACARNREKIGTEYIPQAVKWLRDRRWEDYTESIAAPAAVDWRKRMEFWAKSPTHNRDWFQGWGPAPDQSGCQVPRELLIEFGAITAEQAA